MAEISDNERNQRYENAIEKVFQRSFYDHIVRGRADHEEIFKYIREKPARRKTYRLYNNK